MSEMKRVLALGAGVQSSVVLLMSARGELAGEYGSLDAAVFADTGWEPQAVYDHLDWIEEEVVRACAASGQPPIQIVRCSAGRNLRDDVLANVGHSPGARTGAPLYTYKAGAPPRLLRRTCTKTYKIEPMRRAVRQLFEDAIKPGVPSVEQWFGISFDELQRMRDPHARYITHAYPLVDRRMTRADCLRWFEVAYPGRPLQRSACLGCPMTSDADWIALFEGPPGEWEDTVMIDDTIADPAWADDKWRYSLHRRGPLREVVPALARSRAEGEQLDLFAEECGAYCGV